MIWYDIMQYEYVLIFIIIIIIIIIIFTHSTYLDWWTLPHFFVHHSFFPTGLIALGGRVSKRGWKSCKIMQFFIPFEKRWLHLLEIEWHSVINLPNVHCCSSSMTKYFTVFKWKPCVTAQARKRSMKHWRENDWDDSFLVVALSESRRSFGTGRIQTEVPRPSQSDAGCFESWHVSWAEFSLP